MARSKRRGQQLKDLMTPRVLTVPLGEPASDAFVLMRDAGVRHAVVILGTTVVGVVSDRDLGGPNGATLRRHRTVQDLMRAEPILATPDMTVAEAVHLVRAEHIGCLPIVADGRLVGIVTRTDLLRTLDPDAESEHFAPKLEAIDEVRPEPLVSPNRDKWP